MNTVEDRLRAALTAKADAVSLADDHVEVSEPVMLLSPVPHQHARRRWPALVAAAVVLLTVGVTVLVGHTHHPHQLAAAGRADVPWSQVGPDWTLAVIPGASTDPELELISPSGLHYLICQLPAPFVELQPWTINTGKALLTAKGVVGPDGIEHDDGVLIVDLHTGAQTPTSVGSKFTTVQFASPGLDSLLVTYSSSMQLVSTGTGQVLVRYPSASIYGNALSPDASQVVAGGAAGLTVFDRASGRRVRTLAAPASYGPCQVLRWQPAISGILARCYPRNGSVPIANFAFAADGSRAPQQDSVPADWQQIQLAAGSVAFQPAAHNTPGALTVVFSRVSPTGRLVPLTVPAELEQGRWQLVAVDANLLLFEKSQGLMDEPYLTLQLAAWNPLTGTFTTLIAGQDGQPSHLSYASWQQYSPPLLP